MSWFTDLAGKAEFLLEKVDNTAANVLQNEDKVETRDDVYTREEPQVTVDMGYEPRLSRTASEGSLLKTGPTAPIKARPPSAPRQQHSRNSKKDEKDDDHLFEFLNSNVPAVKPRKQSTPSPGLTRKTPEPTTTITDKVDGKKNEDDVKTREEEEEKGPQLSLDLEANKEPAIQSMDHESPSQPAPPVNHPEHDRTSNLELENKLLRKEVASLNEEMVSQLQRAKDAEKRMQTAEQHLARSEQQLLSTETIVRQLRAAEEDFNEALSAKDSQLAVLRVRIQQADQDIQERKAQIQDFQIEREKLLKDHTDSSGVHSHALEVMKNKMEEAERKLTVEQEARQKAQHESMERQSKLEQEQHAMAESLKTLQKKANDEKARASEQVSALKLAKANLEASRQELKDYKEKAGRILQAKDKVIATLREGRHGEEGSAGGVTSAELDEVCQERDALREELNQTRFRVEQMKAELQDMEHHHQSDADIAQEKLDILQGQHDDEKRKREACEQEIRSHIEDVRFTRDEMQRAKTSLMEQIQERDGDIQRLRNQLATKTLTSTSEAELENRVRALTENLIQKQTVIEALSTEKNSLVLQLERLEQQYRDVQASSTRHLKSTTVVYDGMDDSDENTLSRVKSITSVMPTQISDSRRVKRAVNEIDKFSIRIGLFLRRYPIARLFVIQYMLLLHLWVLIVLLTYKPEIHNTGSGPGPHAPS